jgi:cytochrome c oxidase cbb3-type subunit I/II
MEMVTVRYDNRIVRNFAVATMVWGAVGMLVGLIIALEMFEQIGRAHV